MGRLAGFAAVSACVCAAVLAHPVRAQTPPPDPAVAHCAALQSADLLPTPGAPTRILTSRLVPAAGDSPAYCDATGTVNGTVGIELKLPAANWNGKLAHAGSHFMHVGCDAGTCGPAFTAAECDAPVARGYACIVDDEGHRAASPSTSWAYENLAAEIDFAFRATHLSTLAAKAVTALYYGNTPKRSYYLGCSAAGRQAMVEAQRYPADYDGIVAGAPPVYYAENALTVAWNAEALLDADGKSLFPATPGHRYLQPDLKLLHAFIIDKCDMQDGSKDGIIPDPRACHADFTALQCKGPKTDMCLTAEQIAAAKTAFGGPVDGQGHPLSSLRPLPGSEGNWAYSYLADDGGSAHAQDLIDSILKYLAVSADFSMPVDASAPGKIDWAAAFKAASAEGALYDASNPDLAAFSAHGGKLVAFQGFSDHEVLPEGIIRYYETVERTMGGQKPTEAFFRLFLLPGADHCGNGASADKIDWLGTLDAWVEQNKAPERLVALKRMPTDDGRYNIWPATSKYWAEHPLEAAAVVGSRPIYPYPTSAKYKGKGDANDAANWEPVAPAKGK